MNARHFHAAFVEKLLIIRVWATSKMLFVLCCHEKSFALTAEKREEQPTAKMAWWGEQSNIYMYNIYMANDVIIMINV